MDILKGNNLVWSTIITAFVYPTHSDPLKMKTSLFTLLLISAVLSLA